MKTTISLKQLRTDPREFIRLLNSGYRVDITEHKRTIVSSIQLNHPKKKRGDITDLLQTIDSLPAIITPFPDEDTIQLIKRTKLESLEKKYGERR